MKEFNQVYFKGIQGKIVESIDKSEKKILIAVAWITDEYILNKLLACQKRGVKVSIVFYSDKINNKDVFKKLYEANARRYDAGERVERNDKRANHLRKNEVIGEGREE